MAGMGAVCDRYGQARGESCMGSRFEPSDWWGGKGRSENRLTLLDLVSNRTLGLKVAAFFWLLMEHGVSIVVAAAPQLAGKTTLLTALVDFIPPWYGRVYTRGKDEDFSFLSETDPDRTYILIPELSDHTPAYLWGEGARTLFDALGRGYSMAATIHAETPEQVLAMLAAPPVEVPGSLLHHAGVIANLRLSYGDRDMIRRLIQLTVISPGPRLTLVGELGEDGDTLVFSDSLAGRAAQVAGLFPDRFAETLAAHSETLEEWIASGQIGVAEVQRRVAGYYAAGPRSSQP